MQSVVTYHESGEKLRSKFTIQDIIWNIVKIARFGPAKLATAQLVFLFVFSWIHEARKSNRNHQSQTEVFHNNEDQAYFQNQSIPEPS